MNRIRDLIGGKEFESRVGMASWNLHLSLVVRGFPYSRKSRKGRCKQSRVFFPSSCRLGDSVSVKLTFQIYIIKSMDMFLRQANESDFVFLVAADFILWTTGWRLENERWCLLLSVRREKLLNSLGAMDWMTFRASIPFEILTRGFGLVGWWKTYDIVFSLRKESVRHPNISPTTVFTGYFKRLLLQSHGKMNGVGSRL